MRDSGRNLEALTSDELAVRFVAAQEIAAEAGQLALRSLLDPAQLGIKSKGPQDLVTAADLATERLIIERLSRRFPEDAFLAEESYASANADGVRALWIID